MKNDLLKAELKNLQQQYKNVLLAANENIFKTDSLAIIDEINVFWQQNKKLVQFILDHYIEPYSAYVFTAAGILDVEDSEHYPFVTLGQYHIWDDPIYKYANIVGKTNNDHFDEKMKSQVTETITDNLKLMNIADNIIYILPIRYLSHNITELPYKAGMQAFLSLFKKDFSIEEYKNTFNSITDIRAALRPNMERIIFFGETEDISVDFETRFYKYKNTTTLPLPKDATDAEVFLFSIFSYLTQAADILLMCTRYRLNPYIRFDVAFKYMLILSGNFRNHKEIEDMIFKSKIAHIMHRTFDKTRIDLSRN